MMWVARTALLLLLASAASSFGMAQELAVGADLQWPEEWTGIWEASDEAQGVVGVSVEIDTRGEPGQNLRGPQEVEVLSIGVYYRPQGGTQPIWVGGETDFRKHLLREERYGAPLRVASMSPLFVLFETVTGMGMSRQILVRGAADGKRLLGSGTIPHPIGYGCGVTRAGDETDLSC